MNWASVYSLLGATKACKMFHHRRDLLALHTFDVTVPDFTCEEGVFGESFFDLFRTLSAQLTVEQVDKTYTTKPKLTCEVNNWSK
jgi:hypothetical protein